MIIFEKLQHVKEMITQLIVCCTKNISKNCYKMIVIYLSKQQTLEADQKAIQKIHFTGNLEREATIVFIIEEAKEIVLDFLQGTVKVFLFYFLLQYNSIA